MPVFISQWQYVLSVPPWKKFLSFCISHFLLLWCGNYIWPNIKVIFEDRSIWIPDTVHGIQEAQEAHSEIAAISPPPPPPGLKSFICTITSRGKYYFNLIWGDWGLRIQKTSPKSHSLYEFNIFCLHTPYYFSSCATWMHRNYYFGPLPLTTGLSLLPLWQLLRKKELFKSRCR